MKVTIELFGPARIKAGASKSVVELGDGRVARDLLGALAEAYPRLVGDVISADLKGLVEPYALYVDGVGFVADMATKMDGQSKVALMFSSAGG